MTGTVLALALIAVTTEEPSLVVGQAPALTIDPCAAVDEQTVRQVMELEIQGVPDVPTSVTVACTEAGLEIRVRPWTPPADEGVRIFQSQPVAEDATPAARQARSRELALAIAELIRHQDWRPAASEPVPLPSPAPAPAEVASSTVPTEERKPATRWQLGALSALEYFSGGSTLAGGDLVFCAHLGGALATELKIGGRFQPNESLPGGHLTARAGVAALGIGAAAWSSSQTVRGAVMIRAQGYLVRYKAEASDGDTRTALLGAFSLAAEPSLLVALTSWFALEATTAIGFLPHGIDLRVRGAPGEGISGLLFSGNLGGVLTF